MVQSMFMSVLSSNFRSSSSVQTKASVSNVSNPSTGRSVQDSKDESCKETSGLAGQSSSHEISYSQCSPPTYHQLKYNSLSPSSCSSCSNCPSSPFETQNESVNQCNNITFTQWFEQQLSAFEVIHMSQNTMESL